MKIKLLMFLVTMGLFLFTPVITNAQITDDDLDILGGNGDNNEFGPVSLEPELMKGTISYINKTITTTFLFDLGTVTIWIADEKGQLYISEEVDSEEGKAVTIDIQSLPAQKYKIIYFTSEGEQIAKFEIK